MSAYNCHDCKDTGEYTLPEEKAARVCGCSTGQALQEKWCKEMAHERLNNSAALLERAEQAHKVRMDMLGKVQCDGFIGLPCSIWIDAPGKCEQCERERLHG